MEKTMKIKADDNNLYDYYIDKSVDTTGYSMYTAPISTTINSLLKTITIELLSKIIISNKEIIKLELCNLSKEELIGKYFDCDGYIYYNINNQLYRYNLKINCLKKIYNKY